MSEEGEPPAAAEPRRPAKGKAGRNEGRKLVAGAFNNAGVAFVLAAFLQPMLAYVQLDQGFDFQTLVGSTIFFLIGGGCLGVAQVVSRRVED